MKLIDADALLEELKSSGKAAYMIVQDAPAVDALMIPCKIGDTVWIIITKRPKVSIPEEFSFIKRSRLTWNNLHRILQEFGKSVFLTREEAEAALASMERKEGAESV